MLALLLHHPLGRPSHAGHRGIFRSMVGGSGRAHTHPRLVRHHCATHSLFAAGDDKDPGSRNHRKWNHHPALHGDAFFLHAEGFTLPRIGAESGPLLLGKLPPPSAGMGPHAVAMRRSRTPDIHQREEIHRPVGLHLPRSKPHPAHL